MTLAMNWRCEGARRSTELFARGRRRWRTLIACLAAAGLCVLPGAAQANWYLGQITNNSAHDVTVLIPIGAGGARNSSNLLVRGDIALDLAGAGLVLFEDIGHFEHGCAPYWSVLVTYGDQVWTYYYDGGGQLGVTINADGSIALQAINGKVVSGNRTSPC